MTCHTCDTENLRSSSLTLPLKILLALSGALLWVIADLHHWLPTLTNESTPLPWLLSGLATLSLMILSGSHFYQGAWESLKRHTANMDTLVSIGATSAWIYSMIVVCFPKTFALSTHLYFDTPLFVFGLINIGSWLETRASQSSTNAIETLLQLTPNTVNRIVDGETVTTALEDVIPGDSLRVLPGERIPVDGIIIEGKAHLDEAMLTGETTWISKKPGQHVLAGTLNTETSFLMQAKAVGKDTALHHIIRYVEKAQSTQPQIGRIVDRVTAIFVPVVIGVAAVTAVIWSLYGPQGPGPRGAYALLNSLSVLLVACPCALGLATPIAIRRGLGLAAKNGILIQNAEALTRMHHLDTLIFDKTGTLTQGRPSVVKVHTEEGIDADTLLQLAASVEQYSEHPIAKAVVQHAKNLDLTLNETTEFKATSGAGVEAMLDQQTIRIGQLGFVCKDIDPPVLKNSSSNDTRIYLSVDYVLKGAITISDALRESSTNTITHLQQKNISCFLLSGDDQAVSYSIASAAHIPNTHVRARATPEEKYTFIAKHQETGTVGMVGDGINDAPALAKADVGFAIQSGTDVARASADVLLTHSGIGQIPEALRLSQATARNIRQNLWLAFLFNGLGIPIAAGVLYPTFGILMHPIVAAVAMACSSLSVTLNALRLR